MPVIAEDEELIAQAQERERARLEEEAKILAYQQQQQAIQNQTPFGMIQDAPTAPPIPVATELGREVGPQIGSEQYNQELARAQRGNGYLAANVSPTGDVITAGYDPSHDPSEIIARREAENLQRNQYYSSLVSGGATPAEALRAARGRFPGSATAEQLAKIEQLALKNSFTPRRVFSGGVAYDELRPGSFSRAPVPAPQKFVGGKPTPAIRAKDDILKGQISGLRAQLKPGILGLEPEKAAALESEIARKEQERIALYESPESNPNVDQPSWLRMRDAFNAPPRPRAEVPVATPAQTKAVNEIIRMTRDGRRAVYDAETKQFIRYE